MTFISLVCLLALSSVALARPYGGYGAQPMPQTLIRRPITLPQSGYGQIEVQPTQPRLSGYGQTFISEPRTILPPPMPLPLSRADLICRGKLPETVIVMEDKRGVFVCLDDTKGEEILCQPGLWYHEGLRRCERTLGPIPNACDSQPCLNGGQCFQDGSHYQCQCAPGFDGTICELDARVCQTQQPCGSAFGTRCQSFRPNAALQYICVHQNGLAYGFSAQQVVPSPCTGIDGAVALSITDKGVAYCDGDRLSLESCVEKTHWDDQIKACIWDDETIPGTIPSPVTKTFVPSHSSYGEQVPPPPKMIESYGERVAPLPRVNSYGTLPPPPPRMIESYGERVAPLPRVNSYGTLPPPPPRVNSYGTLPPPPRVNNYGTLPPPPRVNTYGTIPPPPPKLIDSYGTLPPPPPPKVFDSYGEQLPSPPPPKMIESYGERLPPPPPKNIDSYGTLPPPPPPKVIDSYGTFVPTAPKVSPPSGY